MMTEENDLFGKAPRLDDFRMAMANGFLKLGANGGVWSLVGLMRVGGVDISNHFVSQLTRCVEGVLNDDALAEVEARLPDALARIKRKSEEVEMRCFPLRSSLEHWVEKLGYKKNECADVPHFVKVLATGFVFSQLLESFHRERGGNTLIGCVRDLGLEADNNEYVTLLTDVSKHGINGVPQNARAGFCDYLLDALERIRERFAHFRGEAERLLREFENKKEDMA